MLYICIHVYVHMYVRIYVYMCVSVCVYISLCVGRLEGYLSQMVISEWQNQQWFSSARFSEVDNFSENEYDFLWYSGKKMDKY